MRPLTAVGVIVACALCSGCPHDLRRPARDRAATDREDAGRDLAADRSPDRPRFDVPLLPDQGCPSPCVTTLAGRCGQGGFADGAGADARFRYPVELIVAPSGSLLCADSGNNRIRRISVSDGQVTTVAGVTASDCSDGTVDKASFDGPHGLAIDGQGGILVSEHNCNVIRRIAGGNVTTIAGQPYTGGFADGIGPAARFWNPEGLLIDGPNGLLVADWANNRIRRVDLTTHEVTTYAGSGGEHADGSLRTAGFGDPTALRRGSHGILYVSEEFCLRAIAGSKVTTFAGIDDPGSANGPLADSRFDWPMAMAFDASGAMLVTDSANNEIRRVDLIGKTVSTYAGNIGAGYRDGPADQALFRDPWGMAIVQGTVYVADHDSNCIRMIR